MLQTQSAGKKKCSYEEWLALGEDTHCELIGGEIVVVPSPSLEHQGVSRDLEFYMLQYIQKRDLGKLFDAPVDVKLDEENVVQPDLVFVARPNAGILRKRGIFGTPDLVVEILSPSSLVRDRYEKMELYQRSGVPEYWIVDLLHKSIEVLSLEKGNYRVYSFACEKGVVKSRILEGFELEVAQIMSEEYPQ